MCDVHLYVATTGLKRKGAEPVRACSRSFRPKGPTLVVQVKLTFGMNHLLQLSTSVTSRWAVNSGGRLTEKTQSQMMMSKDAQNQPHLYHSLEEAQQHQVPHSGSQVGTDGFGSGKQHLQVQGTAQLESTKL